MIAEFGMVNDPPVKAPDTFRLPTDVFPVIPKVPVSVVFPTTVNVFVTLTLVKVELPVTVKMPPTFELP